MKPTTVKGATPSGGARSEAWFRDATGRAVHTPDQAQTVEIAEMTPDGTVLARTYMARQTGVVASDSSWRAPLDEWSEPDAIDKTKSTWDVWVNDAGQFRLAVTLPDLLAAIGFTEDEGATLADQRQMVSKMMMLPSWDAAPSGLRHQTEQWLMATRGNRTPEENAQPEGDQTQP